MIYQFLAGEERKKPGMSSKTGSKDGHIEPDELADPEVDPADFFDPEEFGYRRQRNAPRP